MCVKEGLRLYMSITMSGICDRDGMYTAGDNQKYIMYNTSYNTDRLVSRDTLGSINRSARKEDLV